MCFYRPEPVKVNVAKNMDSPYFHELSNDEIITLIEYKFRNRDMRKLFKRPDFCMNKKALHDRIKGCGLLTDLSSDGHRQKICPEYCRIHGCQFVSEKPTYFEKRKQLFERLDLGFTINRLYFRYKKLTHSCTFKGS